MMIFFGFELVDDFADHLGAFHSGGADCRGTAYSRDEQDFGKNELVARLAGSAIDPDSVPCTDPELMTAVLDDSVHPSKLLAWAGHLVAIRLTNVSLDRARAQARRAFLVRIIPVGHGTRFVEIVSS